MKINWNKKYTTVAVYAAIVLIAAVFAVFFFLNYGDFGGFVKLIMSAVRPMIYGVIIAFLCNPILKFFEKHVFSFMTGDDPIPLRPEKPEIPTVPEKPEKPEKPVITQSMSYDEKLFLKDTYREARRLYKKQMLEYKLIRTDKRLAEKAIKRIDKNAPKLEKKIARVTRRHKLLRNKTYDDGVIKTRFAARRALSLLSASISILTFIAAFIWMVAPQVIAGVGELTTKMPLYIATVQRWFVEISQESGVLSELATKVADYINNLISKLSTIIQDMLPSIIGAVKGIVISLKDILFGIFFSIYLLLGKEKLLAKIKKVFTAFLPEKQYTILARVSSNLTKNFSSFISAKLTSSLIIGITTFFGLMALNMPYYPLIAVIICVTDVVPMFGPWIGSIPCWFIVFITDPMKSFVFILFILVLQQFEGNIIEPKIFGEKVNVSSLGVLTAITIMSAFFGLTGLLIAVPVFAVAYELIKEIAEGKLSAKGLSTDTADYYQPNDYIGRSLHEEDYAKESHKKTIRQSLSTTPFGKSLLSLEILSAIVNKLDKTEINRQAKAEAQEIVAEELFNDILATTARLEDAENEKANQIDTAADPDESNTLKSDEIDECVDLSKIDINVEVD